MDEYDFIYYIDIDESHENIEKYLDTLDEDTLKKIKNLNKDDMAYKIEDGMYRNRYKIGLTTELKKQTNQTYQEFESIEKFLLYNSYLDQVSEGEFNNICNGFKKITHTFQKISDSNKSLEDRIISLEKGMRRDSYFFIASCIIVFVMIVIVTFSNSYITVDTYENNVYCVETKWWGLVEETHLIKWLQPDGYDSPAWMTKGKDGEWYPHIVEDIRDFCDIEY